MSNTDTMIVSKQELIFKIINILDIYFKDSRAYDFTLFFWPKKKTKDIIQLDIKFNWRISELNEFIVSSSAFSLFDSKNFKSPFMLLKNTHEVSEFITHQLSTFDIETKEFSSNFSLVNGVTLHRDTWEQTMKQLLGYDSVEHFYAEQRFERLNSLLTTKEFKDKLIKI